MEWMQVGLHRDLALHLCMISPTYVYASWPKCHRTVGERIWERFLLVCPEEDKD
jgi:hypothetical protein